ncbi:hypothetical protein [Agarivorans albus]|uniref:Lipoprotein n=1 Tax=Agarivorans albus MKT 106 TaxID=1331007 RepID=R9PFU4_AGAAL|nr:hypothetical protein [Agarivorans albus]GAD00245.1 hypothetical protein AALB_0325 [Agarivorans albus MKT 106]
MRSTLTILSLLITSACSQQQAYHAMQGNQQRQCDKQTNHQDYLSCMDEADVSYEEYQRQRQALLDKDK